MTVINDSCPNLLSPVLTHCKHTAQVADLKMEVAVLNIYNFHDQQHVADLHKLFEITQYMCSPKPGKLAAFFNTITCNCKPGNALP